jgi:hypothetical protein
MKCWCAMLPLPLPLQAALSLRTLRIRGKPVHESHWSAAFAIYMSSLLLIDWGLRAALLSVLQNLVGDKGSPPAMSFYACANDLVRDPQGHAMLCLPTTVSTFVESLIRTTLNSGVAEGCGGCGGCLSVWFIGKVEGYRRMGSIHWFPSTPSSGLLLLSGAAGGGKYGIYAPLWC